MTRARKIIAIVAASLVGLVVVLFIAGITIVQTDWFRNMVRGKIVAAVEEATGGKVDIASFNFDWSHLRATVRAILTDNPSARTSLGPHGIPLVAHAKAGEAAAVLAYLESLG